MSWGGAAGEEALTLRWPCRQLTEVLPRRVSEASRTSSWTKDAVWIISATFATSLWESRSLKTKKMMMMMSMIE